MRSRLQIAMLAAAAVLLTRQGSPAPPAPPLASIVKVAVGKQQSNEAIFGSPRWPVGTEFGGAVLSESSPHFLTSADFDSDGNPDFAIATGTGMTLMLGDGQGAFIPSLLSPPPGLHPTYTAAADLNNDGKPDIVLGAEDVVVLLGSGKGSIAAPMACNVGRTDSFALADLNADGKADLVLGQVGPDRLLLLLGRGDGTFEPATRVSAAAWSAQVATADFDGDGRTDIAMAEGSGVSVFPGNGDGTFQAPVNSYAGGGVRWFAVGDYNRDGKPDLAIGRGDAKAVSLLLGGVGGTFRTGETYEFSEWPMAGAAADLDSDSRLDLVVTLDNHEVGVLLGRGDGTFSGNTSYNMGVGLRALTMADFNRDSKLDLAVASTISASISVLLGNGDGTFPRAASYDVGPDPYAVTSADLNGDGNLDLAIANMLGPQLPTNSTVSILLGKSDGSFQSPVEYPIAPRPSAVLAADFNSDGKLDLITAGFVGNPDQPVPGTGCVLLGKGDGSFQPPLEFRGTTRSLVAGDFNSDGKLDVALASDGVDILLGNGDGTFGPGRGFGTGEKHIMVSLMVEDFNGDGKSDLIAGTQAGAVLFVGGGDGTFTTGPELSPLAGPALLADVNQDGTKDLAIVTNGVWVCYGRSDKTFDPGIDYGPAEFRWGLSITDLNGDSEQDLLLVGEGVGVVRGSGDGEFKSPLIFDAHTRYTQACFALGDFNHDSKPDVAVVDQQRLTVLLNTAGPAPLELAIHGRGQSLTLSWSRLFPGAVLESTDTLVAPHWTAAPEIPVQQFGHWECRVNVVNGSRYFRLRLPPTDGDDGTSN